MLILNGVILVYFFEVDAPGANIVTLGDSLWWAAVTVATVGYGDYYPVTVGGRITAVALMGVGLVTAAVITAQIASTFMDQAAVRRAALAASKAGPQRPVRPLPRCPWPRRPVDGRRARGRAPPPRPHRGPAAGAAARGRRPADASAYLSRLRRTRRAAAS